VLEHVGQGRDEARLFVGAAVGEGGFFVAMRHGTRLSAKETGIIRVWSRP